MSKKRITIFIPIFLVILIIIPLFISRFSKQRENPGPTPSVSLPSQIIPSPTPTPSFPASGLEMVIYKDKNALVPYTNMQIKLTSVFVASKQCMDCITSAIVQVRDDKQLKELKYTSGGFAGTFIDTQNAFGYAFTIKDLQKDSLMVKINKNL